MSVGRAARLSWDFSNSSNTRSRATSLALVFSTSYSFFQASSCFFWRLMSFFCVTKNILPEPKDRLLDAYIGQCRHTPYRTNGLRRKLGVPLPDSNKEHMRQTDALIRCRGVAVADMIEMTSRRTTTDILFEYHTLFFCVLHS